MSAMLLYGQEDDDFAYEDEHIEMESENQEHDDLDEREFDTEGAVIRGEAKSPVPTTISTLPRPAPKPTLAGTVPDANGHGLLQSHPPLRITSANASGLGLRGRLEPASGPPNQNPVAGRARTKLAETSLKGLSEAKSDARFIRKRKAKVSATKAKRPAQKQAAKSRAKAPAKKVITAKRSSSALPKKTATKVAKNGKGIGHARKKTATKPVTRTKARGTARTKRRTA